MESAKQRIRLRIALVTIFALVAVLLVATQANAKVGTEVTSGHFATTQAGKDLKYDIRGFAVMLRVPRGADGRTYVRVFARGLDANATFPTHVHNMSCADGGGGHYQYDVGGAVDAINEIWPAVTTRGWGFGWGSASHGHVARPEAQSIVIHQPGSLVRIACADLR